MGDLNAGSPGGSRPESDAERGKKTRKPYVLSKSREAWSQEEHALFVEGLRLYQRSWRRIEARAGAGGMLAGYCAMGARARGPLPSSP